MPGSRNHKNPLSRPAQEAGIFVHNKVHSVEKDNSGVEGAHKSEELVEKGVKYGARKVKQGYRSHKLKPYRKRQRQRKRHQGECQLPVSQDAARQPAAYEQSPFPLLAETTDKKAIRKGSKGRQRKGYQSRSREHPESGS